MLVVVFACYESRHMFIRTQRHKCILLDSVDLLTHTHTHIYIQTHTYSPTVTHLSDFHCIELHDPGTVCVCV